MRPDEKAAMADIERSKKKDELLKKGAGLAVSAGSAALGLAGASRVLPFLSEHIPFDLAMKGINKVSPKIGQFLQNGQKMGLDVKEGLNFLRDQFEEKEEPKKTSNPLDDFEMNHKNLAIAIAGRMRSGQDPVEAAKDLKASKSFKEWIDDLEKAEGKNFVDYIIELFGNQNAGMLQQPQQQMQPAPQQLQPGQSQPQQPGQQVGDIKQGIMAALDKIMKM